MILRTGIFLRTPTKTFIPEDAHEKLKKLFLRTPMKNTKNTFLRTFSSRLKKQKLQHAVFPCGPPPQY